MERKARENTREMEKEEREKEKEALNGTSEEKKDEKSSAQNIETLYTSLYSIGKRERESALSYR